MGKGEGVEGGRGEIVIEGAVENAKKEGIVVPSYMILTFLNSIITVASPIVLNMYSHCVKHVLPLC